MDGIKKTAARQASVRAFAIARGTVVVFALATAADYVLDCYHLCSQAQASIILPCVRVTAAAAAEWRALWLAMVCCAVLEATVAALALRHPCRALALAYLQLALTVVRHTTCTPAPSASSSPPTQETTSAGSASGASPPPSRATSPASCSWTLSMEARSEEFSWLRLHCMQGIMPMPMDQLMRYCEYL